MRLRHVMIGVGVVMLTSGVAYADPAKTSAAKSADAPWFQRFTTSVDPVEAARAPAGERSLSWKPSARWGVTLNMRDADRTKTADQDKTALGAFYHFTPRLSLGGEVTLAEPPAAAPLAGADQPSAGVKLESAFRF